MKYITLVFITAIVFLYSPTSVAQAVSGSIKKENQRVIPAHKKKVKKFMTGMPLTCTKKEKQVEKKTIKQDNNN